MKKTVNYIETMEINDECFEVLRGEVSKKYSFGLIRGIFALPCMEYEIKHKLVIVLYLLEDGEVNDTIVDWLTQLLSEITMELWDDYEKSLVTYIEKHHYQLSRSQLMLIANSFEVMCAKGYNVFEILNIIYKRVPLSDVEFNPDRDDNVRINLAKKAYSASRYNIIEVWAYIKNLKSHLKQSRREYLFGMLNYYKGLCLRVSGCKNGYKDANHYIIKSKNSGFNLAAIYLSYNANNCETSSES